MCRICGIHNLDLRPLECHGLIDRMSAQIRHRGPDSAGKFERPHLALAIRRLSIIDLRTGDQPLSKETGDIRLVLKGEINNSATCAKTCSHAATGSRLNLTG